MEAKKVRNFIVSVYNANYSTLSGAVKTFTDCIKNCDKSTIDSVAYSSGITVAEAKKLMVFCKNRSRIIFACNKMFANIDGVACEYKPVAKDYRQKDMFEKSFNKIEDFKKDMLLGKVYKPYGYEKPTVELLATEPNYILKESDVASTTYAPFPFKIFTIKRIVKAVCDYIAYCEKNGIEWNKDNK